MEREEGEELSRQLTGEGTREAENPRRPLSNPRGTPQLSEAQAAAGHPPAPLLPPPASHLYRFTKCFPTDRAPECRSRIDA